MLVSRIALSNDRKSSTVEIEPSNTSATAVSSPSLLLIQGFAAQLRVYTPTGQPELGLGTGHVSIEPSILYFRRYDENWTLQAELRDWIPISNSVTPTGENFAGNVLRYGVGLGYDIWLCCDECESRRITPVAEVVGWTILDGFGFDGNNPAAGPIDQSGVTIVNAKFGVRYTVNEHSLYAGYGVPVTNAVWYDSVFRLEYRRAF